MKNCNKKNSNPFYKMLFFVLIVCFIPLWAAAQNTSVKGVVKDETGEPIIGANVTENGTTNGTVTGIDGSYELKVPASGKLKVSFIGYVTQMINVNGKTQLNITLKEESKTLNEVVVVGYGTQKKADLTSSISTLDPKEIVKAPNSITDALQGTVAGVNVSGGKIRIRGTGSITGSTDPLWVVDGVIDGNVPNNEDIESLQVLKDAASCAIYGVRGANGVILVTTKKGKKGKPTISFNSYAGVGSPTKKIHVMNAYDYSVYVNELYYNSSDASSIANGTWNSVVPTHDASPSSPLANTDWWKQYFCTSTFQNYDLSISGANDLGNYRIGGTFTNDGTPDLHTSEKKTQNMYANIEGTKGCITYGGRVFASYSNAAEQYGASLMNTLNTPSNLPVYNSDGSFYITGVNGTDGNDLVNQAWFIHNGREHDYSTHGLGNIFCELKIFDWLKYRLSYTYSFSGGKSIIYTPKYDLGASSQDYYYQSTANSGGGHRIIENLLSYDKNFGKHSFSGVLGVTSETSDSWSTTTSGRSDEIATSDEQVSYQNSIAVSSSKYNVSYYSYLGRFMYSYSDKYLFTANFRADETSKFAKGNRWGYFPSFSAGWRISEEPWMQKQLLIKSGLLNNLKLRATLGWIGSASGVGDYDYQSVVVTESRNYTFGSDQVDVSAPLPTTIANKSLKWEKTRDAGAGFDMDLLNNKLSLVFDYYNRKVSDMLLSVQLPTSTGTTNSMSMNVGSMRNWGIELSATYRDKIGKLKYNISPTFSLYRNKVLSLGNNESLSGGTTSNADVTRTVVGRPVAQFWGYKTAGLFKTDEEAEEYVNSAGERLQSSAKAGDLKYVDVNGDGKISDDDKAFLGSSLPKYSLSLNVSLEYKGFDFSMLWQGDFGNKIYNNWKSALMGGYCAKNQMTDMKNRFRASDVTFTTAGGETITLPANTNTSIPRAVLNDPNNNHTNPSDYFIESGSYFRCNRITLGYTFSKELLQKISVNKLRLYVGVKNPFTITKYSMFDPQVPDDGSTLDRGVDGTWYWSGNTYYTQREPFIGLQLTF
jgi:TonB-dependent starch-binding outer membrane protein SusC